MTKKTTGLKVERYFSKAGNPYSDKVVSYTKRLADIKDSDGNIIESVPDVVFPKSWSDGAVSTVATKYFRRADVPDTGREIDIRQLVGRVAGTIADWGRLQGYFGNPDSRAAERSARNMEREAAAIAIGQYGAFNSPIWFNLGLNRYGIKQNETSFYWDFEKGGIRKVRNYYEHPQGSACFIAHPGDSVEDMMEVAAVFSARLFKGGSGIGSSWYQIRSAGEPISGGGEASGAKRFMDVQDAVARVIKSGGKTRRAAVLQNIPIWHPDMIEVIRDKYQEDRKGEILVNAGSPSHWESHTFQNLRGQNVNISVLADDKFWHAVERDETYPIIRVSDGQVVREPRARDLLQQIAFATHGCGCPGIQNFTTMNKWNTCSADEEIWGSNPCSEYMFLSNSACNLASINLMKCRNSDGSFDMEKYWKLIDFFITAQDILVDPLSYPSEEIAKNSHTYRPLGLGYANLGAYAMSLGLPYDHEDSRDFAAAVTSALTARAVLQSSKLAEVKGPFERYKANKEKLLEVMEMHREAARQVSLKHGLEKVIDHNATLRTWDMALDSVRKNGMRNAQVSLLAPTGTIGFMMDCDTTGCEPDIALKKYKYLAGGGSMKIVNRAVPAALTRLGYDQNQIKEITDYVDENDTIEGAPHLKEEHLPVFDCSINAGNSDRVIDPLGHIKMVGAIQPHLSGGISKTINCPESTSVEDIENMFHQAWKVGAKAVAIYRDGSKGAQPVETKKKQGIQIIERGEREHLPNLRFGMTQKVKIGGVPLFMRTGEYPDGRMGELFLDSMERGSDANLYLNGLAIEFSEKLQAGVALEEAVEVFDRLGKSQVGGFTDHPFIRSAKGIGQFIHRWHMAHYKGDISYLFDNEGKPATPEMRPLPNELRIYQQQPELYLIPTVAGIPFYEGAPTLEETIKKISGTNFWCDDFDGLDTRKTIERIKQTREWGKADTTQKSSGKLTGRTCACGALMEQDGNCYRCPSCFKGGGCGGG